jgi:crotonobetainyl-CoA:carnitine CoA-transferase CaiB-like acyl-CoA transferase
MEQGSILKGVRVLGIETQVAGPYCTMMLADQGAEVIKIERPGVGDSAREMAPILRGSDGETASGYFLRFNRNKKSVALDVTSNEGIAVLKDLIAKSDIIVENNKPGMMDKLGLGWDVIKDINPKVVYIAISGFGRHPDLKGPFSDRPAYDIIAQAMGGLMHLAGQKDGPPTWLGVAVGDVVTGIYASYAALLGLIKAQNTGVGEFIDISMYDCMIALAERAHNVYNFTGQILSRGPDPLIAPWGPFKCKDGYVALIVATEVMWKRLCKAIGHEELSANPELRSGPARAKNINVWMPVLTEWMAERNKNDICDIFLAEGLPCGPIQNSEDVANCPHVAQRQIFVDLPEPVVGHVRVVGSPFKMIDSQPVYSAVPRLGEHTSSVLQEVLGYTDEDLTKLRHVNVI